MSKKKPHAINKGDVFFLHMIGALCVISLFVAVQLGAWKTGFVYDPMLHTISEIAVMIPHAYFPLVMGLFFVHGFFLLLYMAVGLIIVDAQKLKRFFLMQYVGVYALCGMLLYFFPTRTRDQAPTLTSYIHWGIALLLLSMAICALLSVLYHLKISKQLRWNAALYYVTCAMMVFLIIGGVSMIWMNIENTYYLGLLERVGIYSFLVWLTCIPPFIVRSSK